MSIRDILLLASITMNVLLVFLLIVSASDADDSKDQAARLFNTLRARNAALEEARSVIAHKEEEVSSARGLLKRAEKELDKLRKEKESARNSPFAKDFPMQKEFEVVHVPTKAVTLTSSVIIDDHDVADGLITKEEVISRLRRDILTEAEKFIEVEQGIYDPRYFGCKYIGTLRVIRRDGNV